MKKIMNMMILVLIALLLVPGAFAAEGAAEPVTADWSDMLLPIVLAAIIPISSLLANFFEIKEDDPKWLVIVKRIINTLAINISQKAGN